VIQRIQTVYLLLAGLFNLAAFFNPIYGKAMADPLGWIGVGLALFMTLSMLISFISIFFYNNRKRQLALVKAGTYAEIVAIAIASGVLFTLGGFGTFLINESIGVLLLIFALVALWQAGKNIRKDQELVESMDRIR